MLTALRAALLAALLVVGRDPRFRPSFVMALGAIEDALGLPRSCPARAVRRSDPTSEYSRLPNS